MLLLPSSLLLSSEAARTMFLLSSVLSPCHHTCCSCASLIRTPYGTAVLKCLVCTSQVDFPVSFYVQIHQEDGTVSEL